MKPYQHQIELADKISGILFDNGLAYLAAEERTGKTLSSILCMESMKCINAHVLVFTKAKAIGDWNKTLDALGRDKLNQKYRIVSYGSAHKVIGYNPEIIIFDEAHSNISSFPKPTKTWLKIKAIVTPKTKILYLSATPYAQGIHLLYHQLALSPYSPWRQYKNFYVWYEEFCLRKGGRPYTIWTGKMNVPDYTKINFTQAFKTVEHLFVFKTRKDIGFSEEPEDKVHYVELGELVKEVYNLLLKDKVLNFKVNDVDYKLVADTQLKLVTSLHQLEGGVLKPDKVGVVLSNEEKIAYILKNWGDDEKIAVMYNYVAEGIKLNKYFNKAKILQATSYAEGVDLSHIHNLIIYSQNFSTAKYIQRRARQANFERNMPIIVHFLLVRNAVSEQVYNTVSLNKRNFIDSLYKEKSL